MEDYPEVKGVVSMFQKRCSLPGLQERRHMFGIWTSRSHTICDHDILEAHFLPDVVVLVDLVIHNLRCSSQRRLTLGRLIPGKMMLEL